MSPVLAADRLLAMAGSVKLLSQEAVLTPSGLSGPFRVELPWPCDGPAQVTTGTGFDVPL